MLGFCFKIERIRYYCSAVFTYAMLELSKITGFYFDDYGGFFLLIFMSEVYFTYCFCFII